MDSSSDDSPPVTYKKTPSQLTTIRARAQMELNLMEERRLSEGKRDSGRKAIGSDQSNTVGRKAIGSGQSNAVGRKAIGSDQLNAVG